MLVHSDFFVGGTVCGAVLSHENLACIQGGQAEVLLERQRTIVHQKYSVQNHREREKINTNRFVGGNRTSIADTVSYSLAILIPT